MVSAKEERSSDNGGGPPWTELRGDLGEVGAELKTLAGLRWQRIRLAAGESAFDLAFLAWGALVGAVLTAVAAILLVLGLSGAIASAAGDRPWVGDLCAGLLGVGLGGLLLALLRGRFRAAFVRRLERDFAEPPAKEPEAS